MKKLENALNDYFKTIGLQDQLKTRKWLQKWPQVVGVYIDRYTQPLTIKEKVLWVEVLDSNWLYHLTSLQERIVGDFNKIAGFEVIKSIKLINAGSLTGEREVIQSRPKNYGKDQSSEKDIELAPPLELAPSEISELEKYIDPAPGLYKERIRKVIHNFYLQQKKRINEGAQKCPLCRLYYYEYEMKESICFLCDKESENWTEVLRPLFKNMPWLSPEELEKDLKPSKEMFDYCKEKIRHEYFDRIMTFSGGRTPEDEADKKTLYKFLQHYVLFKTEKDPSLIQKEDIFKALKDFGGLFEL